MNRNIIQYLIIASGIAVLLYTSIGIYRSGYNLTGREVTWQIEGGLAVFLILLGLGLVVYGGINIWFNKKQ